VATKTPSKGKKSASKESAPHEKKKSPPKAKAARASAPAPAAEDADDGSGEHDLDDDEPAPAAKPAAAPAKKPAAAARSRGGEVDPPPVVPARRLTPEAKARVNEMVAKGVPLGEALRAAASWETFVAPVKEEPAKLVQGKSFDGPRSGPKAPADDDDEADEEPASGDE
jgi:hypothetical protein